MRSDNRGLDASARPAAYRSAAAAQETELDANQGRRLSPDSGTAWPSPRRPR